MFVSAHMVLDKVMNALVLYRASTQCEPSAVDKYQEFHRTSCYCLAALEVNLLSGVHWDGSACVRHQRPLSIHAWHLIFQWHNVIANLLQSFHLHSVWRTCFPLHWSPWNIGLRKNVMGLSNQTILFCPLSSGSEFLLSRGNYYPRLHHIWPCHCQILKPFVDWYAWFCWTQATSILRGPKLLVLGFSQ